MIKFLLAQKNTYQEEGTSMNTRITQVMQNFIEKYHEIFEGVGELNLEAFESSLVEISNEFCRDSIKLFVEMNNQVILEQKELRRAKNISVHKQEVPREILTKFGMVDFKRTYYKVDESYAFLADKVVGLESYDRVSGNVTAELVDRAAKMSYQQSVEETVKGVLSRQTVMKKIRRTQGLETKSAGLKKKVEILHVVADEDHAAMQSGSNRQVPLITVHEGIMQVCKGRNKCINARHFADYGKSTSDLWNEVFCWLDEEYDLNYVKRIYLHGDGAKWIKSGLDVLPESRFVLDRYHLEKAVKSVTSGDNEEYRLPLRRAVKEFDLNGIENILKEILTTVESSNEAEKVLEIHKYIKNNWEGILIRRMEPGCGGSCTEAQVSHVLAERLSRNPLGWSEEGLKYMSRLRVFKVNGGKVTTKHFRKAQEEPNIVDVKKKIEDKVKELFCEAKDFSVFEVQKHNTGKVTPIRVLMTGISKSGFAF